MKVKLEGLLLMDASFRHLIDPFGSTKVEGPHPEGQVVMEVTLAKAEQPNRYVVRLVTTMNTAPSRYAVSATYAVMLEVIPDGEELPQKDIDNRLMITGASMAYPYCREVVSSLTSRGKYGGVLLNPQSFADLLKPKENEPDAATK